jgi:methyl-accepting chemotaxis protein
MFTRISIGTKLIFFASGTILLTTIVMVLVGAWQTNVFYEQAESEVEKLIAADLHHITAGTLNLITIQGEQVQRQLDEGLAIGHEAFEKNGTVSLSDNTSLWLAVNQFNQDKQAIELPTMYIGNRPIIRNDLFSENSPVVDEVWDMAGVKSTIFQRMNEDGDMLRVATNISKQDGTRAVGTYIPITNPDGTPNAVVTTLLKGETYRGRAFVVDEWYRTAYEPIFDENNEIIGAFYVGVRGSRSGRGTASDPQYHRWRNRLYLRTRWQGRRPGSLYYFRERGT